MHRGRRVAVLDMRIASDHLARVQSGLRKGRTRGSKELPYTLVAPNCRLSALV